jgi:hypothetical protein
VRLVLQLCLAGCKTNSAYDVSETKGSIDMGVGALVLLEVMMNH